MKQWIAALLLLAILWFVILDCDVRESKTLEENSPQTIVKRHSSDRTEERAREILKRKIERDWERWQTAHAAHSDEPSFNSLTGATDEEIRETPSQKNTRSELTFSPKSPVRSS